MTTYNAPVDEMMFLFNNLKDNKNYNEIDKYKDKLLEKWPGPHTWLVPPRKNISKLIIGNNQNIALRLSSHKEVIELCEKFEGALISSSANKEDSPTLESPKQIRDVFPGISVLEGNLGGLNHPSKIQDLITGEVIRG